MRLLIAFLFMVIFSGAAVAQSCSALRAQLASAQSGGTNTAAVDRLQKEYRAYGCNGRGFGRHPSCARIEARMRRAGQGPDRGAIRRLEQRVARVCAQEQRVSRPETRQVMRTGPGDRVTVVNVEPGANVFSSIFGGRERRIERYDPEVYTPVPEAEVRQRTRSPRTEEAPASIGVYRIGNARTVCVRLCDGFYFPINSQSHWSNFADELAMCVGRCPGADVSLYAHDRDAPVESMRSAMTGERYISLPTAFLYREQRVPNCGCEPQSPATTASADEALAFVESGEGKTAEAAAEEAAAETRLSAVFDETGKPLHETLEELRQRRGEPEAAPAATAAEQPTEAAEAAQAPARQPVAATSVTLRVREVGPQFYSPPYEPERRVIRQFPTSTAVSVVPVAASAVVTEDDTLSEIPDAPATDEELLPGSALDAAQTSSLPASPSGS